MQFIQCSSCDQIFLSLKCWFNRPGWFIYSVWFILGCHNGIYCSKFCVWVTWPAIRCHLAGDSVPPGRRFRAIWPVSHCGCVWQDSTRRALRPISPWGLVASPSQPGLQLFSGAFSPSHCEWSTSSPHCLDKCVLPAEGTSWGPHPVTSSELPLGGLLRDLYPVTASGPIEMLALPGPNLSMGTASHHTPGLF